MKKYNIIGDIHGRSDWQNLVRTDSVNIFVGDYFSPYEYISFDEQRNNFMDIIMYKMKYPETILLIGNHDEDHWHINEKYSRYDAKHFNEIKELFEENKDLFQIAYSIENRALVTHAGVSVVWYVKYKYNKHFVSYIELIDDIYTKYSQEKTVDNAVQLYINTFYPHYAEENKKPRDGQIYNWKENFYLYNKDHFDKIEVLPNELSDFINNLWQNKKYIAFDFEHNCDYGDYYGNSITQGPLWIRPEALEYTNIFAYTPYVQFAGHTQFNSPFTYFEGLCRAIPESISIENIDKESRIIYVDCLGFNKESIILENNLIKNNYGISDYI